MSIYEYDEEKHFRTLREEGREEGMAAGIKKGREEGKREGMEKVYCHMFHKNKTPEDISDLTGESVEYLYDLQKKYLATVHEQNHYDVKKETTVSGEEV